MSGTNNVTDGAAVTTGYPQWLRKAEVILVGGNTAYNFTESFRFTFNTTQRDAKSYNTCRVRLYNLSDRTVNSLLGLGPMGEYTKIIVKAGYQPPGNYGTVFQGTITQFTHGRENNINSFLEIYGADGDAANFVVVNQTLAGPVTQDQQIKAVGAAMKTQTGISFYNGSNPLTQSGGVLPRGKVFYGAYSKYTSQLGMQRKSTWSIYNGQLIEVPLGGYLPGDVVVINSATGLIGTPETTQQGITLTCLLNPNIFLGQRIQLNNKEINQTIVTNPNARQPSEALNFFASESADGIYRVCVHEFEGDTRGMPWYSKLTVLNIDPSAVPSEAVIIGNQ